MNGALIGSDNKDYGFIVGDNVAHIKEPDLKGIVTLIDSDFDMGGVTTCNVVWGATSLQDALDTPADDIDIQWTNKLIKLETAEA